LLAAGADPNATAGGVNRQGHAWSAKRAITEAAYGGHLDCLDA
jgi:hypothetical protein